MYGSIIATPLLILLIWAVPSMADWRTFNYRTVEQLVETGSPNKVAFEQVCDTPVVYRIWGVWNFDRSASQITAVATDFGYFSKIFRYVYRCDRINNAQIRQKPLSTWYVEGRAAIARVWAIGNIDTLAWTDSSHFRFIANQNEDKRLEAKWSYKEPGWLNYRTHGVRLAAFVVGTGPNTCRVGIVAQGWVRNPMPQWLIRMAISVVLPQLLQDIETEAEKREKAKNPPPPPWFSKWYHTIFG